MRIANPRFYFLIGFPMFLPQRLRYFPIVTRVGRVDDRRHLFHLKLSMADPISELFPDPISHLQKELFGLTESHGILESASGLDRFLVNFVGLLV